MENILVCITAQTNSKRLIDRGAGLAEQRNGKLHILHVQKGDNIFFNEDAPRLLQELYAYGCEHGGEIHALCGDDVGNIIIDFIEKMKINCIVLGEKPKDLNIPKEKDLLERIGKTFEEIEIVILKKE